MLLHIWSSSYQDLLEFTSLGDFMAPDILLSAYCFDFTFITYHYGLFSKGTPNPNYSFLRNISQNTSQ